MIELHANKKMGCLRLAYKRNDTTLKVAYSVYGKSQNNCTGDYRYGFNGKEKDDEINVNGGDYDFGERIYDSRLGRWLSVDPLANQAPAWTPYRAFFNNPNYFVDLDGLLEWPLEGGRAKNKRDLKAGESTENTVIRTSTYMEIRNIGTSPHVGIDYRAKIGTEFYSLGDGVVSDAGTFKSGIKYIEVTYKGGDKIRFLHISKVADGLIVGSTVKEGQVLGETGNSGKYKDKNGNMVNYQAHLHIDAVDKDGNKIDPEGKNYGNMTNEEFFNGQDQQYKPAVESTLKVIKSTAKLPGVIFKGISNFMKLVKKASDESKK